jgi:beta-lactamase superfamily II metal-dependent hydrolase
MAMRYVSKDKVELKDDQDKRVATLLWGDAVHEAGATSGGNVKVHARGRTGWVPAAALGDRSLLEIYVIDVGQGDGVLMKTPDGKWHLVDAGVANREQQTRKGAANFLVWKFKRDLRRNQVKLENVIVTHSDFDHYGGMVDVLSGKLYDGRIAAGSTFSIEVANLYHNGMARFRAAPRLGAEESGEVDSFPFGFHGVARDGRFITELLSGKSSFKNPPRELERTFAEFAGLVGKVPDHVSRISNRDGYLPGYEAGGEVAIRVLGPMLEDLGGGQRGLRVLGGESITRNGHSVVLRVDYGRARMLLTGDLNLKSQQLLMSYHPAAEFAVDVAKCCHHGSEDVHLDFVQAMQARATVISSGDNEDYSHPRPLVIGASARYGREARAPGGKVLPPLVYSTELARSVKLGFARSVRVDLDQQPGGPTQEISSGWTEIRPDLDNAGFRDLDQTPISTDLVYGLVNVRTDGDRILCATMEEKGGGFDVKVFEAGVAV